ncbi:PAS domain-containing protein [Frateuria sp. MAH-13]|uniref:histidine kinase n=1 Tax=Frateuria flava TaxID=2821489 RepID=A0ABS4DM06_9GAMM|nr:PAS domain-containing protein [Frateuria flava]MBP1474087.1 PAS domain-containing protein [Frateuria flava]
MAVSDHKHAAEVARGSGGVAAIMRSHDWSHSPLGPPEGWPPAIRPVVSLMLKSRFPMFVAWGPSQAIIYNDAYADILGSKHAGMLGRPFREVWPEFWPDMAPLLAAAMAGQTIYRQNLPLLLNREGYPEPAWFTFSYSPVEDEQDQVVGMFCVVAETTTQVLDERRQRFQIELDSAQAQLTDLRAIMATTSAALGRHLGASRVGFSEMSEDGETISCRACFAEGVAPILGTSRLSSYGPDAVARQAAGFTEVASDVESDPAQVHATWRALQTRAYVSVPRVRDGRLQASLYVNFREVHHWTPGEIALIEDVASRTWAAVDRARAVAALRESESRFRALVTAGGYTVYRMSPDWREMLYLESDSFLLDAPSPTTTWMDTYLHPDDRDEIAAAIGKAIATKSLFDMEHRVRLADGSFGWTHSRAVPVVDDAGHITEWFGAAHDVTGRKRNEQALQRLTAELEDRVADALQERQMALAQVHEMQKMETIGQLTGGVAHDFNNLLTPIVGALELLAMRLEGDGRGQHLAAGGLQAAERARVLIHRLLAFSRRQHLAPRPIDVGKLTEGVVDMVSRTVGPQIRVRMECMADLPAVMVDPNQLELALLNLAVNARDAMPEGGELVVGAVEEAGPARSQLKEGRFVRFFVSDTGTGMDGDTARRAIEPFFTTKGLGRGTGLGLSSVHGLAVQSGGDLALESVPGAGTTVHLWLPVSPVPLESAGEAVADTPIRCIRSAVVLLVDDEELVREGTAEMLLHGGYKVVQVASGYEALRKVTEGLVFDALVTDFAMPGMSGADVAREVRKLRPGLPTLLVTGYAQLSQAETGDLPRLAKPFRQCDLMGTLARLLDEGTGRPTDLALRRQVG